MNYFNFPTGSSTPNNNSVGDTSVQVQVANTQSTNSANTNTGPTCTDYLGNIFQEGETADDICDTKQSDSEYKSCISSRRAANIPMICKSGNWLKK